ncbi:hypothetical protein OROGR_027914 [Orobanche gracilis]
MAYVPSARECPLLLQLPSGQISKTNGFISPLVLRIQKWRLMSEIRFLSR